MMQYRSSEDKLLVSALCDELKSSNIPALHRAALALELVEDYKLAKVEVSL